MVDPKIVRDYADRLEGMGYTNGARFLREGADEIEHLRASAAGNPDMDILERLRADDLPGERQYEREARIVLSTLLKEAADEIERLRAAAGGEQGGQV